VYVTHSNIGSKVHAKIHVNCVKHRPQRWELLHSRPIGMKVCVKHARCYVKLYPVSLLKTLLK